MLIDMRALLQRLYKTKIMQNVKQQICVLLKTQLEKTSVKLQKKIADESSGNEERRGSLSVNDNFNFQFKTRICVHQRDYNQTV